MGLEPTNDRGFVANEETKTAYGATVRFGESSAAMGPHIWMWINQPPPQHPGMLEEAQASVHMNLAQAEEIRDKLNELIVHAKETWDEDCWYDNDAINLASE